jgi:hypothetical protein
MGCIQANCESPWPNVANPAWGRLSVLRQRHQESRHGSLSRKTKQSSGTGREAKEVRTGCRCEQGRFSRGDQTRSVNGLTGAAGPSTGDCWKHGTSAALAVHLRWWVADLKGDFGYRADILHEFVCVEIALDQLCIRSELQSDVFPFGP